MSKTIQELTALTTPPEYRPSSSFDEAKGSGTFTAPVQGDDLETGNWDSTLQWMGFDPDHFEVVSETVRVSSWQSFSGDQLHAVRANIRRKPVGVPNVSELIERIHSSDPTSKTSGGSGHRVIFLTDTHIGKGEVDGGGSELLVDRWRSGVTGALEDGHQVPWETVTIALGGDLIEGYESQGGKNIANSDLTLTDQVSVAQQLVLWSVKKALEVSKEVTVVTVPGNHGDVSRVQGRPMRDSYDIQITRSVELACEAAGLDNVSFLYPEESRPDISWTIGDIGDGGARVTMVHGHTFKGGPHKGSETWWTGQITNSRPSEHSSILLYGHFHTFSVKNWSQSRWTIGGSALETESTWFANSTGSRGRPGVTAFDIEDGEPRYTAVY